jgi:hypothetical protein
MKTKSAKQPKRSKPEARVKDMKPKKDAVGGTVSGGKASLKIFLCPSNGNG